MISFPRSSSPTRPFASLSPCSTLATHLPKKRSEIFVACCRSSFHHDGCTCTRRREIRETNWLRRHLPMASIGTLPTIDTVPLVHTVPYRTGPDCFISVSSHVYNAVSPAPGGALQIVTSCTGDPHIIPPPARNGHGLLASYAHGDRPQLLHYYSCDVYSTEWRTVYFTASALMASTKRTNTANKCGQSGVGLENAA